MSSAPPVRGLVRASAGSGKTFRISSRLIELLAGGEAPGTILASTFTRKAAGDILHRSLQRLARAATDEEEARELAAHARADPASGEPPGSDFWRDVLHDTMRRLHRLEVVTLDAHFARTAGSFAHDLGIPPGWGVADEPTADRLRAEAIDETLARAQPGDLVELARRSAGDEARRSVHETLTWRADRLLSAHRALAPGTPGWSALARALAPPPDDVEDQRAALVERLASVPPPLTAKGAPHVRFAAAIERAAERIARRDWTSLVKETLVRNAMAGDGDAPPTYHRRPIPEDLLAALRDAVALARVELGAELAARAEAMGRLAVAYEEAYTRRLLAAGRPRFDDVTHLLGGPTGPYGRPDLAYRLDGGVRHLLLDEFQDTSLPQWRAIVPLIDAVAGPGRAGSLLVVADPKQSIYGWRGAEPVVVDAVEDRYGLTAERMSVSWRSSQVVLDVVNRVFREVHRNPVFENDPGDADVAEAWAAAFDEHRAARPKLPGHVRLVAGPAAIGRGADQPALFRHAAERVRELHRAAPDRSVGVLVRRNGTVARMIFELAHLGVPASEEGGTVLTDSAAVVSALALLRLADHPGDGLARYHVARTPVGRVVGLSDEGDGAGARRVAHDVRRRLLDGGYGPTLRWLAEALATDVDGRERVRLRRLVELGHRWDAEGGGPRATDFVRRVEAERAESPGPVAVRVMTVHRSKGLEFDAVVLPELHGPAFRTSRDDAPLEHGPDPAGPTTHLFPRAPAEVLDLFADVRELEDARRRARAGVVRDSLGTLYVAMTRARHALLAVVPGDGEGGGSGARSHARILRAALAADPDARAVERDALYEAGDPAWFDAAPGPAAPERRAAPPAPARISFRRDVPRARALERIAPSGAEAEGGAGADLSAVLGLTADPGARDRGTVVHAWLERVTWIEEGMPDEADLLRIAARVAPSLDEATVSGLRTWLTERLAAPDVRRALEGAAYPPGTRVETEIPFLRRDGDALVEGVIDRLVLVPGEGGVVRADVLDYKTDRLAPGDAEGLDARATRYAAQLTAYRRAAAELYGLDAGAVRARLVFLEPGVVRDVE